MNKKYLVGILILVLVIMWTTFILFYDPEPVSEVQKELKELKQQYRDCDKNNWCCNEIWEDGRLKERECRQFE